MIDTVIGILLFSAIFLSIMVLSLLRLTKPKKEVMDEKTRKLYLEQLSIWIEQNEMDTITDAKPQDMAESMMKAYEMFVVSEKVEGAAV